MAYKNTYGFSGQLTAPLPASMTATIAQFDANLSALLRTVLTAPDWTFVLVGTGSTAEVLQVFYSATTNFPVSRAQDGSVLNAHVIGDPVQFSLTAWAVAAEVVPPTQVPTATGIVTVNTTAPLAPVFNVTPPVFTGTGVQITGSWPNYAFVITQSDTGCCGVTAGTGTTLSLLGSGLATVTLVGTVATIAVAPPAFTSTNGSVTITGTWPALNFSASVGGAGTVTSVTAGTGIVITGTPAAAPVVNLQATGVVAGTYGSIAVNAYGQLTSVDPAFNPPSVITATAPINVVTTGHVVNITAAAAAEGTVGVVALASSTAPLNPLDHTTAVNPALLASVINSLAGTTVSGFTNWSGEATGLYTNIVSASPVALNIAAGIKAVVRGSVTMVNTGAPGTPVQFGIAIFNTSGPTIIQGNRSITQSSQEIEIIITGPFNSTLALSSTAVPAGSSVVSSALTVVVY